MVHLFLLVQRSLPRLGAPIWMKATTKTPLYLNHGVFLICGRKTAKALNTTSLARRQITWLLGMVNMLGTRCLFIRNALFLVEPFSYSPGRFFAVNELKTMMVHILLNYEVKFEDESHCPDNLWHATSITPNPNVNLLFRKRRD